MRVMSTQPLFAWEALDDSPSILTIGQLLAAIPDATLLASLHQSRGRGRDDYPVRVLWGTVLLTIILRHTSIEACLQELRRNAPLRRLIGIASEQGAPQKWNISRFLNVLGQKPHRDYLTGIFNEIIRLLGWTVEDLGRNVAGDSTALCARGHKVKVQQVSGSGQRTASLPVIDQGDASTASCEGDLPAPTGGRKEYTDDQGKVTRVVTWLGYKLHLLVDVRHEVAVAYRVTTANVGDSTELPGLLEAAQGNLPEKRMVTLAYDKACDDNGTHQLLWQQGVHPVIENRRLWKQDLERMLPGHDGHSNIVHDEAGTVYCYDKVSEPPVRHKMAYMGHESSRGTLKYRCPAVHNNMRCPSMERCNNNKPYGLTVRVKREIDLRRFPPVPRATKQFEKLYKGRTAVERVNARLKLFWGADDGNITGARRFHAYVGMVMVAHAAFATVLAAAPRQGTKTVGQLGSLHLGKVQKALHEKLHL